MKKRGFTITELLITLAVVGVVASLAGPAVVNLMPDKNKIMFLKNYKEITSLTQKMLNDESLYYTTYEIDDDGRKKAKCVGLGCDDAPLNIEFKDNEDAKDDSKYGFLLSKYLGADNYEKSKDGIVFKTPDETCWSIDNLTGQDTATKHIYITYDIDKDSCKDATRRIYSQEEKKPNSFRLRVDKYGDITPMDSLSKAYLINPNNLNNKQKDLACAKAISENSNLDPTEACKDLDY